MSPFPNLKYNAFGGSKQAGARLASDENGRLYGYEFYLEPEDHRSVQVGEREWYLSTVQRTSQLYFFLKALGFENAGWSAMIVNMIAISRGDELYLMGLGIGNTVSKALTIVDFSEGLAEYNKLNRLMSPAGGAIEFFKLPAKIYPLDIDISQSGQYVWLRHPLKGAERSVSNLDRDRMIGRSVEVTYNDANGVVRRESGTLVWGIEYQGNVGSYGTVEVVLRKDEMPQPELPHDFDVTELFEDEILMADRAREYGLTVLRLTLGGVRLPDAEDSELDGTFVAVRMLPVTGARLAGRPGLAPAPVSLSAQDVENLTPRFANTKEFLDQIEEWRKEHPDSSLIFWVRHGESFSNLFRRLQSYHAFSPLTLRGLLQRWQWTRFISPYLGKIRFHRFYSSDLERAQQTIRPVANVVGQQPGNLRRLREVLLTPKADGGLSTVMYEPFTASLSRFAADPFAFEIPNEYSGDKSRKYLGILRKDIEETQGGNYMLASHGMTILLMLMETFGIESKKYSTVFRRTGNPANVSTTIMAYDPRKKDWDLLVWNDNSYLSPWLRTHRMSGMAGVADRTLNALWLYSVALYRLGQNAIGGRPKHAPSDYWPSKSTFFPGSSSRGNHGARLAQEKETPASIVYLKSAWRTIKRIFFGETAGNSIARPVQKEASAKISLSDLEDKLRMMDLNAPIGERLKLAEAWLLDLDPGEARLLSSRTIPQGASYGRDSIASTDEFELVIFALGATPIHAHDRWETGVERVIAGIVQETLYDFKPDPRGSGLLVVADKVSEIHRENDTAVISSNKIHEVKGMESEPALLAAIYLKKTGSPSVRVFKETGPASGLYSVSNVEAPLSVRSGQGLAGANKRDAAALAEFLNDERFLEPARDLVESFLGTPGITKVLRRIASKKDDMTSVAALFELIAARAIEREHGLYVQELDRQVIGTNGRRVGELDAILKEPLGTYAVAEVKFITSDNRDREHALLYQGMRQVFATLRKALSIAGNFDVFNPAGKQVRLTDVFFVGYANHWRPEDIETVSGQLEGIGNIETAKFSGKRGKRTRSHATFLKEDMSRYLNPAVLKKLSLDKPFGARLSLKKAIEAANKQLKRIPEEHQHLFADITGTDSIEVVTAIKDRISNIRLLLSNSRRQRHTLPKVLREVVRELTRIKRMAYETRVAEFARVPNPPTKISYTNENVGQQILLRSIRPGQSGKIIFKNLTSETPLMVTNRNGSLDFDISGAAIAGGHHTYLVMPTGEIVLWKWVFGEGRDVHRTLEQFDRIQSIGKLFRTPRQPEEHAGARLAENDVPGDMRAGMKQLAGLLQGASRKFFDVGKTVAGLADIEAKAREHSGLGANGEREIRDQLVQLILFLLHAGLGGALGELSGIVKLIPAMSKERRDVLGALLQIESVVRQINGKGGKIKESLESSMASLEKVLRSADPANDLSPIQVNIFKAALGLQVHRAGIYLAQKLEKVAWELPRSVPAEKRAEIKKASPKVLSVPVDDKPKPAALPRPVEPQALMVFPAFVAKKRPPVIIPKDDRSVTAGQLKALAREHLLRNQALSVRVYGLDPRSSVPVSVKKQADASDYIVRLSSVLFSSVAERFWLYQEGDQWAVNPVIWDMKGVLGRLRDYIKLGGSGNVSISSSASPDQSHSYTLTGTEADDKKTLSVIHSRLLSRPFLGASYTLKQDIHDETSTIVIVAHKPASGARLAEIVPDQQLWRFSTTKADYFFYKANHRKKTNISDDILKYVDAAIFERGPGEFRRRGQNWNPTLLIQDEENKQNREIFRMLMQLHKPVFAVDIPTRTKFDAIFNLSIVLSGRYLGPLLLCLAFGWASLYIILPVALALTIVLGHPIRSDRLNRPLSAVFLLINILDFPTSFRSALAAEKIEDFVVPLLVKKVNPNIKNSESRKPRILIDYGGAHMDIYFYLRHRWLRKTLIGVHSFWAGPAWGRPLSDVTEITTHIDGQDFDEVFSEIVDFMGSEEIIEVFHPNAIRLPFLSSSRKGDSGARLAANLFVVTKKNETPEEAIWRQWISDSEILSHILLKSGIKVIRSEKDRLWVRFSFVEPTTGRIKFFIVAAGVHPDHPMEIKYLVMRHRRTLRGPPAKELVVRVLHWLKEKGFESADFPVHGSEEDIRRSAAFFHETLSPLAAEGEDVFHVGPPDPGSDAVKKVRVMLQKLSGARLAQNSDVLANIAKRALWLGVYAVHLANKREKELHDDKAGGHQATPASIAEILTAIVNVMGPRDQVVIVPHASPVYYGLAALMHKFFDLLKFYRTPSLPSYPSHLNVDLGPATPTIPTGSLGTGLEAGIGTALAEQYALDHGFTDEAGIVWITVGDSEMDQARALGALRYIEQFGLKNVRILVNQNRGRLDGVVDEGKTKKMAKQFEAEGLVVRTLKFGRRLRSLEVVYGGPEVLAVLDSLSEADYQNVLNSDGAKIRREIGDLAGERGKVLLGKYTDEELKELVSNLAGHDMALLEEEFARSKKAGRSEALILWTIKGHFLPKMEAAPGVHSSLVREADFTVLRERLGVPPGGEFVDFDPKTNPEEVALLSRLAEGQKEAQAMRDKRREADILAAQQVASAIPEKFPVKVDAKDSTLKALRSVLFAVAKSPIARNVVTGSADVTESIGMAPFPLKLGFWARLQSIARIKDPVQTLSTPESPSSEGQHLETSSSEPTLASAMAALGKRAQIVPVFGIYDEFNVLLVETLKLAAYWKAKLFTVSMVTSSYEGSQHNSLLSPAVLMEIPKFTVFDPAFPVEVNWTVAAVMKRMLSQPEEGRLFNLRISPQVILPQSKMYELLRRQPAFARMDDKAIDKVIRPLYLKGGYCIIDHSGQPDYLPGVNVRTIIATGKVLDQAIEASERLQEQGIYADVVYVSSPTLLKENPKYLEQLVPKIPDTDKRPPLVTVTDASRSVLSWMGGVLGAKTVSFGAFRFSLSRDRLDYMKYQKTDAAAILRALDRVKRGAPPLAGARLSFDSAPQAPRSGFAAVPSEPKASRGARLASPGHDSIFSGIEPTVSLDEDVTEKIKNIFSDRLGRESDVYRRLEETISRYRIEVIRRGPAISSDQASQSEDKQATVRINISLKTGGINWAKIFINDPNEKTAYIDAIALILLVYVTDRWLVSLRKEATTDPKSLQSFLDSHVGNWMVQLNLLLHADEMQFSSEERLWIANKAINFAKSALRDELGIMSADSEFWALHPSSMKPKVMDGLRKYSLLSKDKLFVRLLKTVRSESEGTAAQKTRKRFLGWMKAFARHTHLNTLWKEWFPLPKNEPVAQTQEGSISAARETEKIPEKIFDQADRVHKKAAYDHLNLGKAKNSEEALRWLRRSHLYAMTAYHGRKDGMAKDTSYSGGDIKTHDLPKEGYRTILDKAIDAKNAAWTDAANRRIDENSGLIKDIESEIHRLSSQGARMAKINSELFRKSEEMLLGELKPKDDTEKQALLPGIQVAAGYLSRSASAYESGLALIEMLKTHHLSLRHMPLEKKIRWLNTAFDSGSGYVARSNFHKKLTEVLEGPNKFREDGLWTIQDLAYVLSMSEKKVRHRLFERDFSDSNPFVSEEIDEKSESRVTQRDFRRLMVPDYSTAPAKVNKAIEEAAREFRDENDGRSPHEIIVKGVKFTRKKYAWVFKTADLPLIISAFGLLFFGDLGPEDVGVSNGSLEQYPITNPAYTAYRINAVIHRALYERSLTDPKISIFEPIVIKGIEFYPAWSGVRTVWAFKKPATLEELKGILDVLLAGAPRRSYKKYAREAEARLRNRVAGKDIGEVVYEAMHDAVWRAAMNRQPVFDMIDNAPVSDVAGLSAYFDGQFPMAGARLASGLKSFQLQALTSHLREKNPSRRDGKWTLLNLTNKVTAFVSDAKNDKGRRLTDTLVKMALVEMYERAELSATDLERFTEDDAQTIRMRLFKKKLSYLLTVGNQKREDGLWTIQDFSDLFNEKGPLLDDRRIAATLKILQDRGWIQKEHLERFVPAEAERIRAGRFNHVNLATLLDRGNTIFRPQDGRWTVQDLAYIFSMEETYLRTLMRGWKLLDRLAPEAVDKESERYVSPKSFRKLKLTDAPGFAKKVRRLVDEAAERFQRENFGRNPYEITVNGIVFVRKKIGRVQFAWVFKAADLPLFVEAFGLRQYDDKNEKSVTVSRDILAEYGISGADLKAYRVHALIRRKIFFEHPSETPGNPSLSSIVANGVELRRGFESTRTVWRFDDPDFPLGIEVILNKLLKGAPHRLLNPDVKMIEKGFRKRVRAAKLEVRQVVYDSFNDAVWRARMSHHSYPEIARAVKEVPLSGDLEMINYFDSKFPFAAEGVEAGARLADYTGISGPLNTERRLLAAVLKKYFIQSGLEPSDARLVAEALVRMRKDSFELLTRWGVLDSTQAEALSDPVSTVGLTHTSYLADSLKKVVDDYPKGQDPRSKRRRSILIRHLIPMSEIQKIIDEKKVPDYFVFSAIAQRFSMVLSIDESISVVHKIQERVGGSINAWVIVLNKGPQNALSWVDENEATAARIVATGKAITATWKSIISFGPEKALNLAGITNSSVSLFMDDDFGRLTRQERPNMPVFVKEGDTIRIYRSFEDKSDNELHPMLFDRKTGKPLYFDIKIEKELFDEDQEVKITIRDYQGASLSATLSMNSALAIGRENGDPDVIIQLEEPEPDTPIRLRIFAEKDQYPIHYPIREEYLMANLTLKRSQDSGGARLAEIPMTLEGLRTFVVRFAGAIRPLPGLAEFALGADAYAFEVSGPWLKLREVGGTDVLVVDDLPAAILDQRLEDASLLEARREGKRVFSEVSNTHKSVLKYFEEAPQVTRIGFVGVDLSKIGVKEDDAAFESAVTWLVEVLSAREGNYYLNVDGLSKKAQWVRNLVDARARSGFFTFEKPKDRAIVNLHFETDEELQELVLGEGEFVLRVMAFASDRMPKLEPAVTIAMTVADVYQNTAGQSPEEIARALDLSRVADPIRDFSQSRSAKPSGKDLDPYFRGQLGAGETWIIQPIRIYLDLVRALQSARRVEISA